MAAARPMATAPCPPARQNHAAFRHVRLGAPERRFILA
jgi:hypothetical protein